MLFKPHLEYMAVLLLFPLHDYPNLLLFIVMIAVPIVFNSIQLWLFDNILKYKEHRRSIRMKNQNESESLFMDPDTSSIISLNES